MRRAVALGVLIGLLITAGLWWYALSLRAETSTAPYPDPHWEYVSLPVEGFILINPALPDSANSIRLPGGSVLVLPRRVGPGTQPREGL